MTSQRVIEELLVKIRGDESSFVATSRKARAEAGALGKSFKGLSKTLGYTLGGLTVAAGLREIIKQSEETQAATAQLEARIKSTGGAAGWTLNQLQDMAQGLQQTTIFSNEATKGAESLLLTFKSIKGDNFREATQATLDLAAAMAAGNGGVPDLRSAALQVGKALEDPATQMTYLRRSGVSFTQEQIDLVKHLEKTGQHAEAQAIILKELQSEFGGAAAAARNTLGGALTYLGNQFTDALKISGSASAGIVAEINKAGSAIPAFRERINDTFIALNHMLPTVLTSETTQGIDMMSGPQLREAAKRTRATITHLTNYRPQTLKFGVFETTESRSVDAELQAMRARLTAITARIKTGAKAGKDSTDAAAAAAAAWEKEYSGILSSWTKGAATSKEAQDLLVKGIVAAQHQLAGLEFQRTFGPKTQAHVKQVSEQIDEVTASLKAMNAMAVKLHVAPAVVNAMAGEAPGLATSTPVPSTSWWHPGTVDVSSVPSLRTTRWIGPAPGDNSFAGRIGMLGSGPYGGPFVAPVKSVTEQLTSQLSDTKTTIKKEGVEVGQALIEGFLSGANDASGLIRSFMIQLATSEIMKPLKKALGIASPSKEGIFVGAMLGEGILEGLAGYGHELHTAVHGLAAGATSGPGGGAGAAGGAIVLHQHMNYSIQALDSKDVVDVLTQHAPVIAANTLKAMERLPALRQALRGTT